MGNNSHILLSGNKHLSRISGEDRESQTEKKSAHDNEKQSKNLKENASQLLDRKWQKAHADNVKDKLFSRLPDQSKNKSEQQKPNGKGEDSSSKADKHLLKNAENLVRKFTGDIEKNAKHLEKNLEKTARQFEKNIEHSERQLSKTIEHSASHLAKDADNAAQHLSKNIDNAARHLTDQAGRTFKDTLGDNPKDIAKQTFDNLFARAKEHSDFKQFRDQPKEFWNQVRQMSEIRVVETFVKGNFEPRATSRYGELLEIMNRSGGGLDKFLAKLPPGEREVFAARYQMDKTFGADKLFVGSGISLNERGEFALREFLANNGKSADLPLHTILSMLGGDASALSSADMDLVLNLFQNGLSGKELQLLKTALLNGGQMLLNADSAALLSMSFALHQNADAMMSLENVVLELLLPQMFNEKFAAQFAAQHASENANFAEQAAKRATEQLFPAALINGALETIEKYQQPVYQTVGLGVNNNSDNIFGFSAGATGAIMGATVGCVVPLSEQSAGETLGFAASVVVGLADSGLRSLGANTLISIVADGVQNLLNASFDFGSSGEPANTF